MTNRLFLRRGLLGDVVEQMDLPEGAFATPREVLDAFRSRLPKSIPVRIAVDGAMLDEEDLDIDLRDGHQIIILPTTHGEITLVELLVYIAIEILVAAATYYILQAIAPRAKPPGLPQERGDDTSQTYSWDGIKTSYGPGLVIPWVYGRHLIGGQVIWTDSQAARELLSPFTLIDRLRLVLSLCEGPIYKIGSSVAASVNGMGGMVGQTPGPTIPAGILINGNELPSVEPLPGARIWMRPGVQDQTAFPAPFIGVATTVTLNLPLVPSTGSEHTYYTIPEARDLAMIRIVVSFPGGLYTVSATGQPVFASANIGVLWRLPGTAALTGINRLDGAFLTSMSGAHPGTHAGTHTVEIGGVGWPLGVTGPIEIAILYTAGAPSTSLVNTAILRDVVIATPHTLRYPMEALIGFELQAGSRFSGGLPNITLPVSGALVRVWDATNGWSPRCWDVPAAPFNFMTYPPGRNPAWILLDFLLARWGLGSYLKEADLDLPAFRRWSIFCDRDPNPSDPWGEAGFTLDLVGDQPKSKWDWVIQMCSAGRATPVMRGGKISVIYQYRDAHSDAGVSVPAKTTTQLLTSGNCENAQVKWLSKDARPTVFQFQYLDENKGWTQDVLPVEDDGGTLNDPSAVDKDAYRPEVIQAYGVTRASQLFREGLWRHRINRLVRRELTFITGPWALGAEVGDLFDFEHDLLRPFAADVPLAMQVMAAGTSPTTSLTIDHALSGSGLQIVVRNPDGGPQKASIASYVNSGSTSALTLATAVTVKVGAAAVVGKIEKLVETYQIVAVTLQENLKREVRAFQWTPEAYDPINKSEWDDEDEDTILGGQPSGLMPPHVINSAIVKSGADGHVISWSPPASKIGTPTSVYVRESTSKDWILVGTTDANSLMMRALTTGQDYVASICLQNKIGDIVPPDQGDLVAFVPEEFQPRSLPPVSNARAVVVDDWLLLETDLLEQQDIAYFEVASGSSWAARQILARERYPRFLIPSPPYEGSTLLVAARSTSGIYGNPVALPMPAWSPPYTFVDLTQLNTTNPSGSYVGTVWDGSGIALGDGVFTGTFETTILIANYQGRFFWQVTIDRQEIEDIEIGSMDFAIGSGEAMWTTIEGRPASAMAPGIDWQTRISDMAMPIGDIPSTMLVAGHVGEVGTHSTILLESRFEVDGVWTGYKPHVDRYVVAKKIQARLTLARRTLRYHPRARQFVVKSAI